LLLYDNGTGNEIGTLRAAAGQTWRAQDPAYGAATSAQRRSSTSVELSVRDRKGQLTARYPRRLLSFLPSPRGGFAVDCFRVEAPPRFTGCAAAALASRTPGRSLLVNSTPAASSARCNASMVRSFNSSPRSNLATVSIDTFAAAASSRTPKPRAARAMRHCTGNKIITLS
jgi:hypothetical protein